MKKHGKSKGMKQGAKTDNFCSKNPAFNKLMKSGGVKCGMKKK